MQGTGGIYTVSDNNNPMSAWVSEGLQGVEFMNPLWRWHEGWVRMKAVGKKKTPVRLHNWWSYHYQRTPKFGTLNVGEETTSKKFWWSNIGWSWNSNIYIESDEAIVGNSYSHSTWDHRPLVPSTCSGDGLTWIALVLLCCA
jgi:hypothetical protein